MKKLSVILVVAVFLTIGCATVRMQAPKDPIKVDISMRLDVYQHVQKDINSIEDIVTGSDKKKKLTGQESLLKCIIVNTAYAQDLSPAVEEAVLRRKARYAELTSLEQSGVIGENSMGMAVIRKPSDASAEKLVNYENSDRNLIYKELAAKNGTSVADIQKVYAARLQNDAPSGTPIEIANGNWQIK